MKLFTTSRAGHTSLTGPRNLIARSCDSVPDIQRLRIGWFEAAIRRRSISGRIVNNCIKTSLDFIEFVYQTLYVWGRDKRAPPRKRLAATQRLK